MKKRVKEHLITNGYTEAELLLIEAEYNMKLNTKKVKGTAAEVGFKDELEETYLYIQMRKTLKIRQECSHYNKFSSSFS